MEIFISMNLLQMSCVITFEVVEAVRGKKRSVCPTAPVLLTKDSPRNEIRYESQYPLSLHISNSKTKPAIVQDDDT